MRTWKDIKQIHILVVEDLGWTILMSYKDGKGANFNIDFDTKKSKQVTDMLEETFRCIKLQLASKQK
jgi:hypothetical protein